MATPRASLRESAVTAPGEPGKDRTLTLLKFAGLAYVATTPLENVSGPLGSPIQIVGILFLLLFALHLLTNPRGKDRPFPLVPLLPVFLIPVWSAVGFLWTWSPPDTRAITLSYGSLALGAIAIAIVFADDLRPPIIALAAGTVVTAIFILIAGESDQFSSQAQIAGVDQNISAFSLAIGLAALVWLLLQRPQTVLIVLMGIAILIVVTAELRIGSRTGVASMLMLLVVLLMLYIKDLGRLTLILALGAAGTLAFAFAANAGLLPPRVESFLSAFTATDPQRDLIVQQYRNFQDTWQVTGVGSGADYVFLNSMMGVPRNAHSALWKIWIENGIVGLALWAWLVISVVRGAMRLPDKKFFILAAVPILAFGYTLGPMRSNMMWAVFGLALTGYFRFRQSNRAGAADTQGAASDAPAGNTRHGAPRPAVAS